MKLSPDAETVLSFFANEGSPLDASSDLSPRRRIAWRVGDAMRVIIDRLVDTRAPDEEFAEVATDLELTAARLDAFEHGRRYESFGEASTAGGPPSGHTDYSPMIGRANPLAPPMRMRIEGDTVIAEATFGHAYEGPPGCVHGGITAAAFDEVLGATQAASGAPGMTGTLTVVYRAPTPLHTAIRYEATLDDIQGRKVITSASSYAPGPSGDTTADDRVLCATADGIFITVDFEKLAAMAAARDA